MELKLLKLKPQEVMPKSFNRTFMELKPPCGSRKRGRNISFNRTFMELKHDCHASGNLYQFVLIVPLWN